MKTTNCLHLLPKTEGGIRQHFFTIIDGLKNLPLHHLVAGPSNTCLATEVEARGLEYLALEWAENPGLIKLFPAIMQIKKIINSRKIKLVHSHGHKMNFVNRVGCLFSRGKPASIITIHNFSPSSRIGQILKRINQTLDSSTTKIISVSKALLSEEVLPNNHTRATVIYNGIELDKFMPDHNSKDVVKVIGVVARLAPQKGLKVLLNAFQAIEKDFPEIRLHIIGDGPEKPMLIKQAEKLGILSKIKFFGHVADILSALKQIDIFVMPSLSEGLSIATIEAMALQKPIIASRSGGLVEVVENNSGLLVKAGSDQQLSAALKKMILSSELRQSLAANGRKRVEEHFNIEQMQHKTFTIYKDILGIDISAGVVR